MKIPKPTAESRALFDALVPADARVEVKPMFGNVAAFVNGNMFMGVFGEAVGVKLEESDQAALRALGGGVFGPEERPMGGYVALPGGMAEGQARPWVDKALAFVAKLPPKAAQKKR
jgi:TfoX/Sxy family transcriptional regulator of competence genes